RGRRIRVPPRGVRPTQDKVREALFSILGEVVQGCRFLDLYAGSGAVGLEACSRGAGSACWVESDPGVFRVLARNVAALCPDGGETVRGEALAFLDRGEGNGPFDVIFADPPYGPAAVEEDGTAERLLAAASGSRLVAADALLALESAADGGETGSEWALLRDRVYGTTRLRVWRLGGQGD
ncbi:16S rRNA (guanine(966)-N(2))-methyltransferase RsmD, partial [Verrucomicrobiota bacterium]